MRTIGLNYLSQDYDKLTPLKYLAYDMLPFKHFIIFNFLYYY